VTPSTEWPRDQIEKDRIIAEYKTKLSKMDCKHFNKGRGTCPFGNSCFYAHIDGFGVSQKDQVRLVSNSEFQEGGLQVLQTPSLFDYVRRQDNLTS
jgi:E3 ubiquitin-protein ligase makorin